MAWDNDFDNHRWSNNRVGRDVWGAGDLPSLPYPGYGARASGGYGAGNFGAGWGPGYYGGYGGNMGAGYGGYGGYGAYAGYGVNGPWGYGAPGYGGNYAGYGRPTRGYLGQGYGTQGYLRQSDYDRGTYGRDNYGQWDYGQNNGMPEDMRRGAYGQTNFAGRGPRNYQRSDDRIHEDINDRLTSHPGLDASDVQVLVSKGEVTLTGSVDSRWAKREAEDIADSTSGVKDVHNQLSANRPQGEREVVCGTARETRTSETSGEGRSRGKGAGSAARG